MNQIETANSIHSKNNFFTKKRIIIFYSLTVLAIILAVIISILLLKIDIKDINNFFIHAYKSDLFFLWIFCLLIFPMFLGFWKFIVTYIRLKKEKIHVKWYEWFSFSFISFFLNAVTPFATGNEPYTLFWLKTKGVETKKALLILSSIGIMNPLSQILITWPSFFLISASYNQLTGNIPWISGYWVAFAGLIFDLISFISYFTLLYSKRIHYIINYSYYFIRRKIKLSYKTKEEIKNKYLDKATFKMEFLEEMKNYKFYSFLLIGNILWNVIYYSSMYFAYGLSNMNLNISYWDWFNYTNIAVTANNWVPIAGAEGTLQILIITFINGIETNVTDEFKKSVNNIIFIWRLFNFYLPAIIGLICFPFSSFYYYKKYKNLK